MKVADLALDYLGSTCSQRLVRAVTSEGARHCNRGPHKSSDDGERAYSPSDQQQQHTHGYRCESNSQNPPRAPVGSDGVNQLILCIIDHEINGTQWYWLDN